MKQGPRTAAHDRILAILEGRNITQADVVARQQRYAIGGPKPKADLASWAYGPGTVAAMLELMDETLAADELDRLRAALQRLADCDWVITPGDRMDGVRKIARDALGGYLP